MTVGEMSVQALRELILEVLDQIASPDYNHAVTRLKAECLPIPLKGAVPAMTIGMTQIVGKRGIADSLQRVVDDNVLNRFHC